MAEVVGVFASGIAVAQLAGTIVASSRKIYTFWSNIKDAPKNVIQLIEEVEILGGLLLEYYDNDSAGRQQTSPIINKTFEHCRDAMNELDEILRTMDVGIKKSNGKAARHWMGMKAAMKGNLVQDLVNRLERARSLLGMARSCNME